jgi:Rrf2 family iron-sulfur cluster assembly transcriptional regulator
MLYGRAAEVAIRAALYLAGRPPGELSPVHDVARATNLSSAYLSKIIQRLAPAGLVRTFRGPGGGIQLGKSPEAITLWSLVSAIEGRAEVDRCALGLGNCSSENPCPFHKLWAPQRGEFRRLLEETTIAALLTEFAEVQAHDQQDQEFQRRTAEPSFFYQAAPERRDRP